MVAVADGSGLNQLHVVTCLVRGTTRVKQHHGAKTSRLSIYMYKITWGKTRSELDVFSGY